jgi:predicted transcriptional regulator of viral defense system
MTKGVILMSKQRIMDLAKKNQGSITRETVVEDGVHSEYLRQMVMEGSLQKVERGYYVLRDVMADDMEVLQTRFRRGIFSHESALYLLGYTDRSPLKHCMTFPRKYNIASAVKNGVLAYRIEEKYYSTGQQEVMTPSSHLVKSYCIERTLCDLLRPHSKVSVEIVVDAFKRYAKTGKKNLLLLYEYASMLHVERKVRDYLEVLL